MSEGQGSPTPASTPEAQPQSQSTESNEISQQDLETLSADSPSTTPVESKELASLEKEVDKAKSPKEKAKAEEKLENAKRKYKLKVDGNEEEVEYSDEEVRRELQLARKARKEIQTSSELKNEVAKLVQLLKTDPAKVLENPAIGVDIKEFAKKILAKQLEDDSKSPEQLEKERLQQELEQLREQMKSDEERRSQDEYNRMVVQAEQDIEEKTEVALKESGLPKSPFIIKRMAEVMLAAYKASKDISPKQALSIVRKEMNKDIKDMFSVAPEEVLEELIGADTIKRLNKKQLQRMKQVVSSQVPDTGRTTPKNEQKTQQPEAKKVKVSDWLRGK